MQFCNLLSIFNVLKGECFWTGLTSPGPHRPPPLPGPHGPWPLMRGREAPMAPPRAPQGPPGSPGGPMGPQGGPRAGLKFGDRIRGGRNPEPWNIYKDRWVVQNRWVVNALFSPTKIWTSRHITICPSWGKGSIAAKLPATHV